MKTSGPQYGKDMKLPGQGMRERRKHVRVSPADAKEVSLSLNGESFSVSDLSLGGVSFWIPEGGAADLNLTDGKLLKIYLKLPNAEVPFPMVASVLARMPNGLLRCAFKKASRDSMMLIQQYIVIRVRESVGAYF